MLRLTKLLASFIIACALIQGASSLIGGSQPRRDKYPWLAVVLVAEGNRTCGAAILDDSHVISSALCLGNDTASSVIVGIYRSSVMSSRQQSARVLRTFAHPGYDNLRYRNNLVIFRTERFSYTEFIQPVSLSDAIFDRNVPAADCFLAGFGLVGQNPDVRPTVLQELQTRVLSKTSCKKKVKKRFMQNFVSKETMCTLNTGSGPCAGDGGGPLFCFDSSNGLYRLTGTLSYGHHQSSKCAAGLNVYTKMSTYLKYISKILRRN